MAIGAEEPATAPPSHSARAGSYVEPLAFLDRPAAADAIASGLALPFGNDRAFTAARIFRCGDDGDLGEQVVSAEAIGRSPDPLIADIVACLARPVGPVRVMGIVNVTPDSFSDGGRWLRPEAAIDHGLALSAAGADIVDVGGESTRPGAMPVPVDEEIERVVEVVRALARRGLTVSIDTRNAATMAAALQAGARMVNDVSALRHDSDALEVVAQAGCDVVLMHSLGDPQTMQLDPRYRRACLDVYDHLALRIAACVSSGIPRERIAVDPGIGFGKHAAHSLDVLQHLSLLRGLGCPVLVGVSRKSFIAHEAGVADLPPAERLPGSLAAALAAVQRGASVLRVHDVPETVQALRVVAAVTSSA